MPNLDWNEKTWDGTYDWSGGGEEWSRMWGGSEAQWAGSLFPRLHRFLPCHRILEIAPGFGRWTRFLLRACGELVGVDLSSECIEACRNTFGKSERWSFLKNDGKSLADVGNNFDLVFSFDSLVHADLDVFQSYIPQIISVLSPTGAAFIHHSNYRASGEKVNTHARSQDVDAESIEHLVASSGGHVMIQERVNWGSEFPIDCFTLFGKGLSTKNPIRLLNVRYMDEADLISHFQSPYSHVAS